MIPQLTGVGCLPNAQENPADQHNFGPAMYTSEFQGNRMLYSKQGSQGCFYHHPGQSQYDAYYYRSPFSDCKCLHHIFSAIVSLILIELFAVFLRLWPRKSHPDHHGA